MGLATLGGEDVPLEWTGALDPWPLSLSVTPPPVAGAEFLAPGAPCSAGELAPVFRKIMD